MGSLYFGRNNNVSLEPTTAYPSDTIPEVQEHKETIDTIPAGATVEASCIVSTDSIE
jgi:hypothetical protein